jgi:methylase of polypeptide subunit release factors
MITLFKKPVDMFRKTMQKLLRKQWVRRSRLICLGIFGYLPYPTNRKTLWDSTSLILKEALSKWVINNTSVLEIGTGDVGLLSNYLVRKKNIKSTAVDICAPFVTNSAARNNKTGRIDFLQSDLFEQLDKHQQFDLIFANPPYVKSSKVVVEDHISYHGFKEETMAVFASDGGVDGLQVIRRIIEHSDAHLRQNGSLLIGYNQHHVDTRALQEFIHQHGYSIEEELENNITSCKALQLKKAKLN